MSDQDEDYEASVEEIEDLDYELEQLATKELKAHDKSLIEKFSQFKVVENMYHNQEFYQNRQNCLNRIKCLYSNYWLAIVNTNRQTDWGKISEG